MGQYQHDMPKKRLDEALGGVVGGLRQQRRRGSEHRLPLLLERISGLSAAVSKNIVKYREENGAFTSRNELKKVNKLGPKAFVQCAGFLRVPESKNVLDNTGVHPESYGAAKELLKLCGFGEDDVKNGQLVRPGRQGGGLRGGIGGSADRRRCAEPSRRSLRSLLKPGQGIPRDELPPPLLRTDILELKDLEARAWSLPARYAT